MLNSMDSEQMKDTVVYEHRYSKIILRSYTDKDGKVNEWGMIHINSLGRGAIVAALTKEKELILERSFRIPLKCEVYELPGGLNDVENESPLDVAKRELLEETGYIAENYQQVAEIAESPGMSDQVTVLYIAEGATKVSEPLLGASEEIAVVTVPLKDARAFLGKCGVLVDAKVYAALAFLEG